jgi:hypothetical protein
MQNIFYEGNVLWAFDEELSEMNVGEKVLLRQISFSPPLSKHHGRIYLTDDAIIIDGDRELLIALFEITQIYHGFDEVFTPASAKNFGLSWQPLRITFSNGSSVYLLIDYNYLTTANAHFFSLLQQLLG